MPAYWLWELNKEDECLLCVFIIFILARSKLKSLLIVIHTDNPLGVVRLFDDEFLQ